MGNVRRLAGVSVAVAVPSAPLGGGRAPGVLLGHGAGSDFREALVSGVADGLAAQGYLAATFNFPYREQGRQAPDRAPVLEACVADVAAAVASAPDLCPPWMVLGGKSMGGRIASQAVARGLVVCRGLLLLAYPLHPAGAPDRLRRAHLGALRVPMLFVSGTRDPLARLDLLEENVRALGDRATLHLVDGGDHSLHVPRRSGRTRDEVLSEVVATVIAWLDRLRRAASP